MPYSCQAQLATSGSIVWPDGAGIAVLGIGREMSHTSRLTIVQIITLPPSGGFSGGRSTIAEYGLRSCGVMAPSWVSSPGPALVLSGPYALDLVSFAILLSGAFKSLGPGP